MPDPLEELRATIRSAAGAMRDAAPDAITPTLERPPKPELGDYSTNAAMLLAPAFGQAPRDVAERLRSALDAWLAGSAERVEVAGPGFVNLFLADRWHCRSGPGRPGRTRPKRYRGDARADSGNPGALRGALRHLVLGALPARGLQDPGGDRASAPAGSRLRERGRDLAADG